MPPIRAAAALLLAAACVVGCAPKAADGAADKPAAAGRTAIRFATDWRAEAEQGGFYEALADGEYARRGLDVRIIQGGPGSNVPQLLAAGAADLGIGSNSFGVMNLAAEHVPVRAVMATFQKDPQVLLAHPGTGVASLADLRGRPILLADAGVGSFWPWLKTKYGLSDSQVRKYSFNSAPFIADPRAVQEGYVTSEPYTIEQTAHFRPVTLLLADAGYPGYAAMVLAPDRLTANKPAAVRAFVEASIVGWKDYLYGDSGPGDRLIEAADPDMRADVLAQARARMRDYGIVGSGDARACGLGCMTDATWARFFDMAAGLGVYPRSTDWRAAYTLAFLPKADQTAHGAGRRRK